MSWSSALRAAQFRVGHSRAFYVSSALVGVASSAFLLTSTASCESSGSYSPESDQGVIKRVLRQLGLTRTEQFVDVPLPTDSLQCHAMLDRFGRVSEEGPHRPVVLVSCGSFNPPTCMHLRMFEVAAAQLRKAGYDVLGGYMSPVNDGYGKPELVEMHHRVNMAHLAAATCPSVMVDEWEASQSRYVRTLHVLQRIQSTLQDAFAGDSSTEGDGNEPGGAAAHAPATISNIKQFAAGAQAAPPETHNHIQHDVIRDAITEMAAPRLRTPAQGRTGGLSHAHDARVTDDRGQGGTAVRPSVRPHSSISAVTEEPLRVMLLCGADLVASMLEPGVWKEEQLRQILDQHGIVAVGREGASLRQLVTRPNTLLYEYRNNIIVVDEPVSNNISSTLVRKLLAQGEPVRYLLPEPVLQYIEANGLYTKR